MREPLVTYPVVAASSVPWLTVEEMTEADRLAVDDFGIDLLQMMEHAGSALAELVDRLHPKGAIALLAGGGNNGGGGLCAARHLANRGREVHVSLTTTHAGAAAAHHLHTLAAMGIQPDTDPRQDAEIVVDAMVGYGLRGALRGRAAEFATWSAGRDVVSLDFPSGLGHPGRVDADATLTLALPKQGLEHVPSLYLADLGLPAALWERLGLSFRSPFRSDRIVAIAL